MDFRKPPARHWRSYGTEPLPPAREALDLPLRAFPSWFLRIECDRCGKANLAVRAFCTRRLVEKPESP
jgi:hypothetical protein